MQRWLTPSHLILVRVLDSSLRTCDIRLPAGLVITLALYSWAPTGIFVFLAHSHIDPPPRTQDARPRHEVTSFDVDRVRTSPALVYIGTVHVCGDVTAPSVLRKMRVMAAATATPFFELRLLTCDPGPVKMEFALSLSCAAFPPRFIISILPSSGSPSPLAGTGLPFSVRVRVRWARP